MHTGIKLARTRAEPMAAAAGKIGHKSDYVPFKRDDERRGAPTHLAKGFDSVVVRVLSLVGREGGQSTRW